MEQELERIKEYMNVRGIRMTAKRLSVITEVFRTHDHFDADGLYQRMSRKAKDVSRATVYRTLEMLVEGGFVRRHRFQENFCRFEHVLGHSPHAHLICLDCRKILEFQDDDLDRILAKHSTLRGFEARYTITEILGLCPQCRAAGKGP